MVCSGRDLVRGSRFRFVLEEILLEDLGSEVCFGINLVRGSRFGSLFWKRHYKRI